jgi:tripeptide aminopeptidase
MNNTPLVNNFLDLVRIDSPSGQEQEVASFLQQKLTHLNFRTEIDQAGNLFAANSHPGNPVLINAHMDTVEPGRGIKPQIKAGVITSDGTTILGADNKSALAAIITALEETDPEKVRPLEIIFSVREETDGGVSEFDFSKLKSRTGIVADRASRIGSIVLASPWIINLNIQITGRGAHSSLPESAINALNIASLAIIKTKWGRIDPQTTTNIGLITGGTAMNSIPENVVLVGEIRSFSQTKLNQVNEKIKSTFSEICGKFSAGLDYKSSLYCPGYKYGKKDNAVREIVKTFRSMGLTASYEIAFGASDANTMASKGISLIAVGDGCKDPHMVRESISVADLEKLKLLFLNYMTAA